MAAPKDRRLLEDARAIWQAGIDAVAPERLLAEAITLNGPTQSITTTRGDVFEHHLAPRGRVLVVGGGKAGAGMARGLEAMLSPLGKAGRIEGLLSVPADCVDDTTRWVHLVGGRPAGINEPRPEGAAAAEEMLRVVGGATPDDLVICLLSGGGSALLPAPSEGITLEDKTAVARLVAAAGGTIDQLNTVRQHLSRIKGGGLARASRASQLVTLIISDVLGDPLDLIASGPTVAPDATPAEALATLETLGLLGTPELANVIACLSRKASDPPNSAVRATNLVLANNATAVDAAGVEAERRGYSHAMDCATTSEGSAEEVGRQLAAMAVRMRDTTTPNEPDCLITGGEPTVTLAPADVRGKGGRNQQLVLTALRQLGDCRDIALLSGGTDGEDGPTDAAGAMIDAAITAKLADTDLDDHLRRNDAYPLLESADALLMTGPTNTNVCDLRVVTVRQNNA